MLGQNGQLAMPHARRAVNCLRNRGGRRINDDFADRLRAERTRGFVGILELDANAARVKTSGQTVREQV